MRVRIKTWGEMEKEFGLLSSWSINCRYSFTTTMEKSIPKNRIIALDYWNPRTSYGELGSFIISRDMIAEYLDDYEEKGVEMKEQKKVALTEEEIVNEIDKRIAEQYECIGDGHVDGTAEENVKRKLAKINGLEYAKSSLLVLILEKEVDDE